MIAWVSFLVAIMLCSSAAFAAGASDLPGAWAGDRAVLISGPNPPSISPSQAEAEAQAYTIVITADIIELQTAAGVGSYPYTVLEENETSLTIQTALGSTSGTTERALLVTWVDSDTIQLRIGNAPYEIVFTRSQ